MAEQWLAASPSATLPRLRPIDGSWAALCYSYPNGVGAMTWLSNYLTLGSLIQPEEWRRAAVLLEWQACRAAGCDICAGAERERDKGSQARGSTADRDRE